jgi:23S rRNA (guanine745-N1)-methyltransferase
MLHRENKSWFCPARHCYDVAKSGYVNLLPANAKKTKDPGDNPDMIASRARMMDCGYYKKLGEAVLAKLNDLPHAAVADIGCGEGYLTRIIKERYPESQCIGIDISKYAADAAARRCKDNLYIVASSAAIPLADKSVDVFINTFAPIELNELRRVLSPCGSLIKIVPAPDHLWQLKELLYEHPYKNPEVSFDPEGFLLVSREIVAQTFHAAGDEIEALLRMTPYYYKTSPDALAKILSLPEIETILSFNLSVYKPYEHP